MAWTVLKMVWLIIISLGFRIKLIAKEGTPGLHSTKITLSGFLIFCDNCISPTCFSLFLCCKSVIIVFKSQSHYLTECTLLKLANSMARDELKCFVSFVSKLKMCWEVDICIYFHEHSPGTKITAYLWSADGTPGFKRFLECFSGSK